MSLQTQAGCGHTRRCLGLKATGVALMFGVAALMSGCSGYDVELNGGVFDALGVSGDALKAKRTDKKMAARPGLVVPPSTASLPAPGTGRPAAAPQTADGNWPVDPEDRKADNRRVQVAQHNAFCAEARRKKEAGIIMDLPDGPLGSCHQSIIKNLTGKDLFRRDADPQ